MTEHKNHYAEAVQAVNKGAYDIYDVLDCLWKAQQEIDQMRADMPKLDTVPIDAIRNYFGPTPYWERNSVTPSLEVQPILDWLFGPPPEWRAEYDANVRKEAQERAEIINRVLNARKPQ